MRLVAALSWDWEAEVIGEEFLSSIGLNPSGFLQIHRKNTKKHAGLHAFLQVCIMKNAEI